MPTPPSTHPSHSTPPPAPTPAPSVQGGGGDDTPRFRYNERFADEVELKWQAYWDQHKTFVTPNPGEPGGGFDASRPKYYVLDMFPYPSGAGLHVGHPEGYTATDIVSRFYRMKGYNVLHPMGWDAFGLPAEQYAIQTGIHPAITTKKAIDNFRRQLQRFGFSYDWSREVGTIDPEYYKWTQWIFLRAYNAWFDPWMNKARTIDELVRELSTGDLRVGLGGNLVHIGMSAGMGSITGEPVGTRRWHELSDAERHAVIDSQRLVYLGETTVNWCPALGTVLANDEVIDGKSERGGHPVLRKPLKQWMFRITAYAERLLRDLDALDWPESTKTMQREWIGRSEGAEIDFEVVGLTNQRLRVFTTRPDTLFGATYMVVAPEHPLVKAAIGLARSGHGGLTPADAAAIEAYVTQARNKSDIDRQADAKTKTGVFTGLYALNPASGERIPIWTADYVLMGYGHGAIMAVPAHDERDFEFAQRFGLPIRDVVYSRTFLVMRYYSLHASERERTGSGGEEWKTVLADMLGLATTAEAKPDFFPQVLEAVRQRREQPESMDDLVEERAGMLTPRGELQSGWLDAIKGMGFHTFEDLRERFANANVHATAGAAYTGPGYAANSRGGPADAPVSLDDLSTDEAKAKMIEWLDASGFGQRQVNFRLRDWAFSRQRYWGEPFPIVYDREGRHYPVSEPALPVELPELADYAPVESDDPMPLLAKATTWVQTTAGAAGVDPALLDPQTPVRRETNTMPGSAGSSWYFLRYCDARNSERFISREADAYWMGGSGGMGAGGAGSGGAGVSPAKHAATNDGGRPPDARPTSNSNTKGGVDLYLGGSEHAVGHLLYSRFWQKLLFDLGEVCTPEPFQRLFHQGMITSYAYQRADKRLVPVDEVEEVSEGKYVEKATGEVLTPIIAKMSKSLKNVVNPDDIIAQFGADTFRLYEMYMGPLDASKPWNTKDAVGLYRFLQRTWRLLVDEQTGATRLRDDDKADLALERQLHRLIAKVDADVPRLAFNTAIAAMFEFVNAATTLAGTGGAGAGMPALTRSQGERLALVLAPFAPHMAEEFWSRLGHPGSLAYHPFPVADPAMLVDDQVEIPVQVNGKVRAKIMLPAKADKAQAEAAALADERVRELLNGQTPKKVIVVPGKMINFVL